MRTAAALFVGAHGIGYSIWFLSSWTPTVLGGGDERIVIIDAPATAAAGKALGLVALLTLAGFLAAAWGIWNQTAWWPLTLLTTMVAAVPVALLWNPVGNVSAMATPPTSV